ncbi:MAG: FMN-binding protein [Candidatus Thiodiazotropha sp.]
MSSSEAMQQPATPAGPMIRTLMGVAMLSGFLVVLTYQLTKPIIAENQRRAIEAAVFQVIPGAVSKKNYIVSEQGLSEAGAESAADGIPIYAGYDAEGRLLGVATNASAQGYADLVHLLYGYDPSCQCIRGIKVLKLAETPGLGDKILHDPGFIANFDQLDARLNDTGSDLEHDIVTVKHGTKHNPWEIDAISGATISSKAVGKALNLSTKHVLPMLFPELEKLQTGTSDANP